MAPPTTQSQQDNNPSTEYRLKKYLLLLATLVVAVTYVAGLNLPGVVSQDDEDGRRLAFYYCNSTAFAASVVVCLLLLILQEGNDNGVCGSVLRVVMVLDLLGLMGAYAAGSCHDTFTTIYSTLVMSVVLAYAVLTFSLYIISKKCKDGKQRQKEEDGSIQSQRQEEQQHEVLMLLATFVVTVTYGAGLSPPDGLQDHSSARYRAFFVCNTTAFVASLLIIMLLLDKRLYMRIEKKFTVRLVALYGLIVVALFGLVGAYAAGSCREIDNTIYAVSLIGAVLAYIFLLVPITEGIKGCLPTCCRDNDVGLPLKKDDVLEGNRRVKKDDVGLEKAHHLVILLATLVASVTYQAGLDPPGGLWSVNDQDGRHKVGHPVLLTTHPRRYKVFFYSNSAAFVASLVVILMVKCKFPVMCRSLEAAMLVDLFGLIGAYAAGCCRDVRTSIYVVALAGAVLVYVVIHITFLTLEQDSNNSHGDDDELNSKREVLLLLAILVTTVTYQAGLTPPGGFWPADDKFGHHAGFPVLLNNYPGHYQAFFYCNATSFMASMALIVLLVNPNLYRPGIRCYAFFVCMVVGLFGLMGAYAAGSSWELTPIYVLVLFALVFTCVTSWVVILLIGRLMEDGPSVGDAGVGLIDNTDAPPLEHENGREKKNHNDTGASPEQDKKKEEKSQTDTGASPEQDKKEEKSHTNTSASPEQDKEEKTDIGAPPEQDKEEEKSHTDNGASPEQDKKKEEKKQLREYLMLLGVLAASVAYQSGLKPPGGLWKDNDGHSASHSILHDIDKRRYHAFFYSNSTSFMASIVIIVLLLPLPFRCWHDELPWSLHMAILLDLVGLLVAYAAGSTRDWAMSRNVIALVIPLLVYIASYAVYSLVPAKKEQRASDCKETKGKDGGISNDVESCVVLPSEL